MRMGRDKVLLPFEGRSFVENTYEKASVCFERIIISTDTEEHAGKIRALPLFAGKNPEIVTDRYRETGPIGGLLSVFEETDAERFSVISVDVPYARMEVLAGLFDECDKKACFLKIKENPPEPLIAAWDRKAYPELKQSFAEGKFKLRRVLLPEDVRILDDTGFKKIYPELENTDFEKVFRNFNTPEEFEKLYE